jgi:hypothetical protein
MYTTYQNGLINTTPVQAKTNPITPPTSPQQPIKPLQTIKQWLETIEIHNPAKARFFCKMIPAQCPFERDICLFGRRVAHIPPLCKLNPFYDEFVSLRFRALCYLADQCGEDISAYC